MFFLHTGYSFPRSFANLSSSIWLVSVEVPPGLCPCHLFTVCTLSIHDPLHFSHQVLHMSVNPKYLSAVLSSPQLKMYIPICLFGITHMTNKHLKLTMCKTEYLLRSTQLPFPTRSFFSLLPSKAYHSITSWLSLNTHTHTQNIYDIHLIHQQILLIILLKHT